MFVTPEPWEAQYFRGYDTSIDIPVSDDAAYVMNHKHNWVYNKLTLMQTLGIDAYPLGIAPTVFPYFVKPIVNLWGMGIGASTHYHYDEERDYKAGCMWMPVLSGTHYSIDIAVSCGEIVWDATTVGNIDSYGSFTDWKVLSESPSFHIGFLAKWVSTNLSDYTGMINFEFIGETPIECHLRMTTQWVDLYPKSFIPSVISLYENGGWTCNDSCEPGYSFVARTDTARVYPSFEYHNDKISSYQLTYRSGINVEREANDAVSYRIAVVNGHDYTECKNAVAQLKELIVGGIQA